MKILMIKLGAFGDIVHTLPAIDDLLQRPEVNEVHFLVDQRYAFVTGIFPRNVQIHVIDIKNAGVFASSMALLRKLRNMHFDATLELQGLIKSSVLARFISSRVYGMDSGYCRERISSWLTRPVRFHPEDRHVVQQYRRVATGPFVAGVKTLPSEFLPYRPPHVQLTDRMHSAGSSLLSQICIRPGQYVVLHLGGGWETKTLPEQTWQEVAKGVIENGLTPLFCWGNAKEEEAARKLGKQIKKFIILPRRVGTPELCGLLAEARAVIGADTGVLHLAAALGTNTATFWGPSASWRSGPLEKIHIHVEAGTECGPCFQRKCNKFICMDQIRSRSLLQVLK